jgi:hypothetical protein
MTEQESRDRLTELYRKELLAHPPVKCLIPEAKNREGAAATIAVKDVGRVFQSALKGGYSVRLVENE